MLFKTYIQRKISITKYTQCFNQICLQCWKMITDELIPILIISLHVQWEDKEKKYFKLSVFHSLMIILCPHPLTPIPPRLPFSLMNLITMILRWTPKAIIIKVFIQEKRGNRRGAIQNCLFYRGNNCVLKKLIQTAFFYFPFKL